MTLHKAHGRGGARAQDVAEELMKHPELPVIVASFGESRPVKVAEVTTATYSEGGERGEAVPVIVLWTDGEGA